MSRNDPPLTEAEWLSCTEPWRMLDSLHDRASIRKLSLFGVACARRAWYLLSDARLRHAVDACERFADGAASLAGLQQAAFETWRAMGRPFVWDRGPPKAATTLLADIFRWLQEQPGVSEAEDGVTAEEHRYQCAVLRDLFNPFHDTAPDPAWLGWDGGTVVKLAQAIYEERRFGDLPVLGDALEDAGCTDAAILGHCRGPGPHVRGCWVLDLLLGRE
jgi:hypothetical protein